jgi:Fe-S cluster assembly iron-binding protein IscA
MRKQRLIKEVENENMPLINLDQPAIESIRKELQKKGLPLTLRIEIRSTGCCDASLSLVSNTAEESDLIESVEDLTIRMSPSTYELMGTVSISYVDNAQKKGFVLTSSKPLNEWEGFAACNIIKT